MPEVSTPPVPPHARPAAPQATGLPVLQQRVQAARDDRLALVNPRVDHCATAPATVLLVGAHGF